MWFSYSDVVKRQFVLYYQKLFTNTKLWQNHIIENIDLTKEPIVVVENYAYRGEQYPAIIISADGGQVIIRDLSDIIGDHHHEEVLGEQMNSFLPLGYMPNGKASVAVQFTPSEDFSLEQINLPLQHSGYGLEGDISVTMYQGGAVPGSGSIVASGSLAGFQRTADIQTYAIGFGDKISLSHSNTYWLLFEADSSSGYYTFIDSNVPTCNVAVQSEEDGTWSIINGQSLVLWGRGNSSLVFGGDVRVTVGVQIAARDEKTAGDIFDIALLFTELAKKAEYSNFHNSRIKIESIAFSGDQAPLKPSINTNIYVKRLTIQVVAAWTFNVDKDILEDFGYNISTFV